MCWTGPVNITHDLDWVRSFKILHGLNQTGSIFKLKPNTKTILSVNFNPKCRKVKTENENTIDISCKNSELCKLLKEIKLYLLNLIWVNNGLKRHIEYIQDDWSVLYLVLCWDIIHAWDPMKLIVWI